MIAEISGRPSSAVPVRAVTVTTEVMSVPELVMNAFAPSTTHAPLSSTARRDRSPSAAASSVPSGKRDRSVAGVGQSNEPQRRTRALALLDALEWMCACEQSR